MTFEEFKEKKFAVDPSFKAAYDALVPLYELIQGILDIRIEHNLTTQEMAEKAGVDAALLEEFEMGEYDCPIEFLLAVLRPFGKTLTITPIEDSHAS